MRPPSLSTALVVLLLTAIAMAHAASVTAPPRQSSASSSSRISPSTTAAAPSSLDACSSDSQPLVMDPAAASFWLSHPASFDFQWLTSLPAHITSALNAAAEEAGTSLEELGGVAVMCVPNDKRMEIQEVLNELEQQAMVADAAADDQSSSSESEADFEIQQAKSRKLTESQKKILNKLRTVLTRMRSGKADQSDLKLIGELKLDLQKEFDLLSPEEQKRKQVKKDKAMAMLGQLEQKLRLKLENPSASASSADSLAEIQSDLDLVATAESVHQLFEVAQDQRMVKLKEMQRKLQKVVARVRSNQADQSDLDVLHQLRLDVEEEFAKLTPEQQQRLKSAKSSILAALGMLEGKIKLKLKEASSSSSGAVDSIKGELENMASQPLSLGEIDSAFDSMSAAVESADRTDDDASVAQFGPFNPFMPRRGDRRDRDRYDDRDRWNRGDRWDHRRRRDDRDRWDRRGRDERDSRRDRGDDRRREDRGRREDRRDERRDDRRDRFVIRSVEQQM